MLVVTLVNLLFQFSSQQVTAFLTTEALQFIFKISIKNFPQMLHIFFACSSLSLFLVTSLCHGVSRILAAPGQGGSWTEACSSCFAPMYSLHTCFSIINPAEFLAAQITSENTFRLLTQREICGLYWKAA